MKRLTKKEYWDSLYDDADIKPQKKKRRRFLRTICYSERVLWDNLFKKYLPKKKGLKMLEIGSAPGDRLIKFHQLFGYVPYGVDYSKSGVSLNRKKFIFHNLNPKNIFEADFLSSQFQKQHKNFFDIVLSRGIIEHFASGIAEVIDKHLYLLKPGGILIIIIPNLRGANRILQLFFSREVLFKHNLEIMEKKKFLALFSKNGLTTLYCNYFGTFNFGLFRGVKKFCNYLQWILNFIFHLLFRNRGLEHKFFSPYLIFIGKK